MRTATITLQGADFAGEMVAMRTWLDLHLFEPARFTYKQDREIVVISVDFREDEQAKAFQNHFTDRHPEADFPLRTANEPLRRAVGNRLGGGACANTRHNGTGLLVAAGGGRDPNGSRQFRLGGR
jgi:hypothetical protein